jgi:hypothetical protein
VTEHNDDHADADEGLPEKMRGQLASRLSPQWPPPARAAALRARVLAAVSATPLPVRPEPAPPDTGIVTRRGAERRWEERWPGIEIAILREDCERPFLPDAHAPRQRPAGPQPQPR